MRALAILAVTVLAAPAAADVIALPRTKATLDVPASWTRADAPGLVAGFRSEGGAIAAITRAQVPNPDAWRARSRELYADAIERGVVAAARGARVARKLVELGGGVPALDLEVKREGGALLVVRVLLFRTYALALAIEGGDAKQARAVAASFAPPAEPKPPP